MKNMEKIDDLELMNVAGGFDDEEEAKWGPRGRVRCALKETFPYDELENVAK